MSRDDACIVHLTPLRADTTAPLSFLRFHGVLAPRAKLRPRVVPKLPDSARALRACTAADTPRITNVLRTASRLQSRDHFFRAVAVLHFARYSPLESFASRGSLMLSASHVPPAGLTTSTS